ncbi:E3 ubiquitin-protein ligase TRIM50 [Ambystoma mexicanum]|uniref:E3 ubiquitin-protein ligase TRIM50 n=1 Tax=Ambystoma mexicanum TaxID=8296 RepID=UPI0037E74FC6
MARKMSIPLLEDQLQCPICLEVFKEPLMLQCGHSYCKSCLVSLSGDLDIQFLCPVCRQKVNCSSSPPNVTLARIIETLQALGDSDLNQESCPDHHNPLSLYCEKDCQVICGLCGTIGSHRQHQITPISSVYGRMKEELSLLIREVNVQKRSLEEQVGRLINNKTRIADESDAFKCVIQKEFQELHKYIEDEEAHFLQTTTRKTSNLIASIEAQAQQITQTLKNFADIESSLENLNNENHLDFIRKYSTIASRAQLPKQRRSEVPYIAVSFKPGFRHDDIKITVWKRLFRRILPTPEVLKLDPMTAHPLLDLSKGDTVVQCRLLYNRRDSNPERFDYSNCVLANKGFSTGKHYWEVVVGGKQKWRLGIMKGTTSRKGKLVKSPENGIWVIGLKEGKMYEAFTNPRVTLPLTARPQRIGIFLDYERGELSFYNADSPHELIHIYSFHAEFQGKLFPLLDACWQERGTNTLPLILPSA